MFNSLLRALPWSSKRNALLNTAKSPKGRVAAKLLIFNYLQAGLSFAVSMWLAKELGDVDYGVVGYGFTIAAICSTLVDFGGERTLVRDLTQSPDAQATMTASLLMRAILSLIVGSVAIIWLSTGVLATEHRVPLSICAISGVLFGLSPKGWYDFRYQMGTHAGIMFAEKLLYCVLTVSMVLIWPSHLGVLIVASCLFGSRLLSFILQWSKASQTFAFNASDFKENISWLIAQNTLVAAAAFANLIAPHVNGLILGHQKGEAAMGHFFLAFQVVAVVQILQQVAARMLVPRIAEVTREGTPAQQVHAYLIRFIGYSLVITLVLVVPLILLARILISSLLPESYLASVFPLRLLLFSCIAHSIGLIVNHFLICMRCNGHYFATSIGKGVLALVLGWLLIPQYGANGVAFTVLACATLTMMVQWYLTSKAISRRASES